MSRYLSYILRHSPESIGLKLDDHGWALISELISCAAAKGRRLTMEMIHQMVRNDPKGRYAISRDGLYIRANQGHTIDVDLQLEAVAPPVSLFHGTAERFLDTILKEGLKPMKRHHVHLSVDRTTAEAVGQRYGKVVVLQIDCRAMHQAGYVFYVSQNNVWLTNSVPTEYIRVENHNE